MEYKKLAKIIKKKSMIYHQIFRDEDFAVYGVGSKENSFLGFEVFEIQKHDGYEIAGNKILPTEFYPKDELFGYLAFHCETRERANLRLQQLRDLKQLRNDNKVLRDE